MPKYLQMYLKCQENVLPVLKYLDAVFLNHIKKHNCF